MSERLTTEQVEAIETSVNGKWPWYPDSDDLATVRTLCREWRRQRAVAEAARCVAAAWDETERGPVDHDTARFECALEELTTALAAVEGGEGEAT